MIKWKKLIFFIPCFQFLIMVCFIWIVDNYNSICILLESRPTGRKSTKGKKITVEELFIYFLYYFFTSQVLIWSGVSSHSFTMFAKTQMTGEFFVFPAYTLYLLYWIRYSDSTRLRGMKKDQRPIWYQPLHYPPCPWKVVPHYWGQLFQDPGCWPSRGLNLWPPAWQTSTYPIELTRWWLCYENSTFSPTVLRLCLYSPCWPQEP